MHQKDGVKHLGVIYKEETMEYDDEVDVSQEVADKIDEMIMKGELKWTNCKKIVDKNIHIIYN